MTRKYFASDPSGPNKSLAAAVRATGRELDPYWRGSVLVSRDHQDVSMADYLEAMRYIIDYRVD